MRNVKLTQAWSGYVKGDWAAVMDNVAENLIRQGIAIDPTRPKPEPVPEVMPKATKKKAAKKKAKRRK